MKKTFLAIFFLTLFAAGCNKSSKQTFWIYTSMYNHVVQDIQKTLSQKFPDVDFKWYQAGSENVAAKVNAEILSGKTQADLIMTSDLFWFDDLKDRNLLLSYDSPATSFVPPNFKSANHTWVVSRVPIMVIAYHLESYNEESAPKSFEDLTLPRFKDKVAMGSPLESGTTFTTVAFLSKKLGWDYFMKLRKNSVLSTGGNSAVISRIETKERPVGIVLLENVLASQRKGQKIGWIIPKEGAVMIPSPIAITSTTRDPELAKKVFDFFFSTEGQSPIVKGEVHSIRPELDSPQGTPKLSSFIEKSFSWTPDFLAQVKSERVQIKEKYSKLVLE